MFSEGLTSFATSTRLLFARAMLSNQRNRITAAERDLRDFAQLEQGELRLGANGVQMPLTEFWTGLQSGLVVGGAISDGWGVAGALAAGATAAGLVAGLISGIVSGALAKAAISP